MTSLREEFAEAGIHKIQKCDTVLCIQWFSSGDPKKSRLNHRKHGVSFERAVRVFQDPGTVSYIERIVEGEERWHTIGLAGNVVLLLVVHTVEEENGEEKIRIISARKADSREQSLYETHR